MSQNLEIRIFSVAATDLAFEKGNLGYSIYWLMQKGDKPYYFREKSPRNFPVGSIALFNFENQIFGQAVTSEEIKKYSQQEHEQLEARLGYPYKASVRFEPSSIDVFHKYPLKTEVEKILGKKYSRTFTEVTWEQYQEILRLAERRP